MRSRSVHIFEDNGQIFKSDNGKFYSICKNNEFWRLEDGNVEYFKSIDEALVAYVERLADEEVQEHYFRRGIGKKKESKGKVSKKAE